MAKVQFSRRAEVDFDNIADYTVRTWDAEQADRYLALLETYCQRIADTPAFWPGLRPYPSWSAARGASEPCCVFSARRGRHCGLSGAPQANVARGAADTRPFSADQR
ncbi:MAG: type II toxin-antitoxin system RelE/ParE family toxin [Pseudomonadota bacterium]